MSVPLSVILLSLMMGNMGAAARPMISFSPNWTPILTGDSVTLTCNGAPPAQGNEKYSWYRDNNPIPGEEQQNYIIQRAQREHSGRYQCQTSERSAAINLTVSDDIVVLQAPPGVHEGEELILRCYTRPEYKATNTVFYKNNSIIQSRGSDYLVLGRAQTHMSGSYKCRTKIYDESVGFPTNYTSAEEHLSVTELFTVPQIKVSSDQVTEGDHMTITCDTKLSPHRETTELQFVFYRNGHNVQGFSLSNQYGVPSAQLEDSGNYTCEVQTPTGSVRKRSNVSHIHIQELFRTPQIKVTPDQVTEGDHMTITCDTNPINTTELQFAFYINGTVVQEFSSSHEYRVPSAAPKDSGKYTCEVQTPTGSVKKRSSEFYIQLQALLMGNMGAAARPVISFSPNWTPILAGDNVTLTCNGAPPAQGNEKYSWYRDNNPIPGEEQQNYIIQRAQQREHSGRYQCQTSERSAAINLTVSDDKVVLQAPPGVHEGEELTLRCYTRPEYKKTNTLVFYKNNSIIQSLGSDYLVLGRAQTHMSGSYKCRTKIYDKSVGYTINYTSAEEHLLVTELFTVPLIKVRPVQVTEGDHMTITCDTKLSPHRETTELQFVFYRNGHNVQGFSLSNQYGVPSAQLEDSGNYTCEVQTPTGSVRKRSNMTLIWIQELFPNPLIKVSPDQVTEGDHMTITCDTKLSPHRETTELQFVFYRNGHNVQGFSLSNQYGVPSAQLEDSGKYTCEVQTTTGSVRKRSREAHIYIQGHSLLNIIRLILSCIIFIWTVCLIFHHIKTVGSTERAEMEGMEMENVMG
ncbi:Fc receptor-like protein 5 isoform X1 [Xenopus laevis]|uniref:Fc receptor-like protein 5 isoform X1 n=1 Tax=Xenopus laevis TaxID=8355 RepID=A0A8J1LLN9_XENLA|nr:Fc receptor-like protein 5 isoform X1 [Xenopus laevis]